MKIGEITSLDSFAEPFACFDFAVLRLIVNESLAVEHLTALTLTHLSDVNDPA